MATKDALEGNIRIDTLIKQFEHSERCLELRAAERFEREAFLQQFLGACQACHASGFVSWQESRGEFWGASCSEWLDGECESCLAHRKCPRCGKVSPGLCNDDDKLVCNHCGWTPESETLPEVSSDADCGCYEDWLDRVENHPF